MRFIALASAILASSSAVLAAPATEQQNQCCCCDILAQQVVCVSQAKPNQCMCAEVMCPSNAPTVYATGASIATTVVPASLTSVYATPTSRSKFRRQVDVDTEVHPQCCCCNAKLGSIVCTNVLDADNCSCSDDKCPDGAPTIHPAPGTSATPTPPPRAHPLVGPIVIRDEEGADFSNDDVSDGNGAFVNQRASDDDGNDDDDNNDTVSEPQERDASTEEVCCHCDYNKKKNRCNHSHQCGFPVIPKCEFETVWEQDIN